MDAETASRLAARTTGRCRKEFPAIEQRLSPCFRTNPGADLDDHERRRLLEIVEWVEARQRLATSEQR